jgi:hypothetical protein
MRLHSGDTSSCENFLQFLEDTLSKLKSKTISLIRPDSGFCSKQIPDYPDGKSIDYIIAARFYQPVQRLFAAYQNWPPLDEGIEIAEMTYQGFRWVKPRRMAVIRQYVNERPQSCRQATKTL